MCETCDIWNLFDGPGSKCSKCQVTKSSITELREINGVQYYAIKETKSAKQENPYWVTL